MSEREELSDIIFYSADWSDIRSGSDVAADLILAAGYRKPRTITTVEELEALAAYAVICYHDPSDGASYPITARDARLGWDEWLPATVLWTPEVTG